MKKNTKKGFTLVELLVVIAILAILASVAVVGYTAFVKKANESKAKTELHQIVASLNADFLDDGKWETFTKAEIDADDMTAFAAAINAHVDFDGLNDVSASIADDGKIQLSYTVEGVTVTEKLD